MFFLSLQHKSNSRWSHYASGQCCPFCFHIANTNCSRRFFLFRKHAPAEPLFYYGTMVKINHTLVFAHWCSHTGGRQPILNRATAAPWGVLGMQRLLIKMQNVRAFGAMEVVASRCRWCCCLSCCLCCCCCAFGGFHSDSAEKNLIVFGLAETAL